MVDSNNVREDILNAACDIVFGEGISRFTLEQIAKKAGISKGGLLYHFSTKEILIKEMIKKFIDDIESNISTSEEDSNDVLTEKFLLAHINDNKFNSIKIHENGAGLLAAVAMNKELLAPIREKSEEWQKIIDNCSNPILANIIMLAVDGIRFSKILGLNTINSEIQKKVLGELSTMVKEIGEK